MPPGESLEERKARLESLAENDVARLLYVLDRKVDALPVQFGAEVHKYGERQRAEFREAMAEHDGQLLEQFRDALGGVTELQKQFVTFRAVQNAMVEDLRRGAQRQTALEDDVAALKTSVSDLRQTVELLAGGMQGFLRAYDATRRDFHARCSQIQADVTKADMIARRAESLLAKLTGVQPTPEGETPEGT